MEFRVLTVIDHGEEGSDRVTFQVMHIAFIRSPEKLVERQGLSLHRVLVKTIDGDAMEVYLNGSDYLALEEAVGFMGLDGL